MSMAGRSRLVLDQLVSKILTTGAFDRVNGHEPKSSPGSGVSCSVQLASLDPDPSHSGLASVSARLAYLVRVYLSNQTAPADGIDPAVLDATDQVIDVLGNGLTLGGNALDIDLFGMSGAALGARAGYWTIDNKQYRIMDITVPILLDDVWTQGS